MSDELLRRVAVVAHDCWVAKMRSEGWSYGVAYDAERKLHNAMAPFDELSDDDRRSAMLCARVENLPSALAGALDYPRGPDRQFFLHEMRESRRVAFVHGPRRLGSIVGWDIEGGGTMAARPTRSTHGCKHWRARRRSRGNSDHASLAGVIDSGSTVRYRRAWTVKP